MPRQPLSTRLSGARSNIGSVLPSSPSLAKSPCQGAQAKAQSQKPKDSMSRKENKAPQEQTRSHAMESPQASADDVATPLPLTRPSPEVTPDALAKPRQWMPELHLPKEAAVEQSPLEPVTETDSVLHAASEQVRGLGELAQLDFFDGEMPVKNTFISFPVPSSSPPTTSRAKTKPLSGDSAPKNWAPGPFDIEDSDQHDLSKFVAAFWTSQCPGFCGASLDAAFMEGSQDHGLEGALHTSAVTDTSTHPAFMGDSPCPAFMGDSPCPAFMDASPEPYFMGASPDALFAEDEQTAVENPMVINLQQSLAAAVSAPKQDTKRIQLNLSLWIPSESAASSSRVSTGSEPPPRVRLGQHHFPVSQTLPAASPEGLGQHHFPVSQTCPVVAAAALVGTGPGISSDVPVSRRLLFHNSI